MSTRALVAVGALVLCVSCSDDQRLPAEAETAAVRTSAAPEPDAPPDPVVAWLDGVDQDWDASWGAARVLIDDGCVMLASADGAGEPVLTIWPIGTSWDPEASEIILANGFSVREGDVIAVGGGEIPVDQGADNNVNAAGLGNDGLAKLQVCAAEHPGAQLWLLDADGTVEPATSSG